jgi:hypothetical protein
MEATIVAIQEDVSKCYREDSIQTTVRAANGHVKRYCGLLGQLGGTLNVYWKEGSGISLD